jgi:hypothetical protein
MDLRNLRKQELILFFESLLKEASFVERKKVPESNDFNNRRKNSSSGLGRFQVQDAKKAINLGNLNTTKSGFNKRLLSKLGCHLVIKLIGTDVVHDVVSHQKQKKN